MACKTCQELLNEALNLAVRSDQFEAQRRRQDALDASIDGKEWEESGRFDAYVEMYNLHNPASPIATRSLTQHLWVQDQYNKDLADWQARARRHLMQGCGCERPTATLPTTRGEGTDRREPTAERPEPPRDHVTEPRPRGS